MESDDGLTTIRLLPNGDIQFEAPGSSMESTEEKLDKIECDSQTKETSTVQYHLEDISIHQINGIEVEIKCEDDKAEPEVPQSLENQKDQNGATQECIASSTTDEGEEKKEDHCKIDEPEKNITSENVEKKSKSHKKNVSKKSKSQKKKISQENKVKDKPIKKKKNAKKIPVPKGLPNFVCFGDIDGHLFETPIPEGWSRKAVQRQLGASAGKYDTYIYSPLGKKFRSRVEVATYLKETNNKSYNLDSFQFTVINKSVETKRTTPNLVPKVSKSQKIKTKKSGEKLGPSNTSKLISSPNLKKDSQKKRKLKIKIGASRTGPQKSSIKDSATSSAILDKLIPSLADSNSLSKSLFNGISFNKNKRKNIHSTDSGSIKKLKVDQNSSSIKNKISQDLSVASTSKFGNYPKIMPENQKKSVALQKKKSYLYGPSNRPLMKKTSPSTKLKLKERNKTQKARRGHPRKDGKDDVNYPALDLSDEQKLIKDIAKKDLYITLIKCDIPMNTVASQTVPKREPEVQSTESTISEKLVETNIDIENQNVSETVTDVKLAVNEASEKLSKTGTKPTCTGKSEKSSETESDVKPVVTVESEKISDSGAKPDAPSAPPATDQNQKTSEEVTDTKPKRSWIPPQSPYNLIYEKLYPNKWELLIGAIIMRSSNAQVGTALVWKFLEAYPTPEAVKQADQEKLAKFLHAVDTPRKCAKKIKSFTNDFDTKSWVYPGELSSIGKYGTDIYKIFYLNEWRKAKPDEYDLCVYHNWLSQNHVHLQI